MTSIRNLVTLCFFAVFFTASTLSLCALLALLYRFLWSTESSLMPLVDSLGGAVRRVGDCESFPSSSADGNVTEYLGIPFGNVGKVGALCRGRLRGVPAGHGATPWRCALVSAVPMETFAEAADSGHD
ncbi:hypothetical protein MRX96_030412 [Rhipicephalus microplus]